MSLKARRYVLTGGLVVTSVAAAIGVATMVITRRFGGVAILAPLLLLPSLVLHLRQVQRVECGLEVEDASLARLRGRVTPPYAVVVAVMMVVLEIGYALNGSA